MNQNSTQDYLSSIFKKNEIKLDDEQIKSFCLHILFSDQFKCGLDLMRNNKYPQIQDEIKQFKQVFKEIFELELSKKTRDQLQKIMLKLQNFIELNQKEFQIKNLINYKGYILAYIVLNEKVFLDNALDELYEQDQKEELIEQIPKIIESVFLQDQKLRSQTEQQKNPIMKQKRISTVKIDQSKNCFSIYETYTDQNSEYKMTKVRFNNEEFEKLFDIFKKENTIRVFGIYGDHFKCVEIAEKILDTQFAYESIKKIIDSNNKEGIMGLINAQRQYLALIYYNYNDERVFDNKQKADSSKLTVIYLRYLIDLCENIFVAPSDSFEFHPSNPYATQDLQGGKTCNRFQSTSSNDRYYKEIPQDQSEPLSKTKNLMINKDFSQYFVNYEIQEIQKKQTLDAKLQTKDIELNNNQKQISLTYNEIKKIVIDSWSNSRSYFTENSNRRKFIQNSLIIFEQFTPKEEFEQLEKVLNQTLEEYIQKEQEQQLQQKYYQNIQSFQQQQTQEIQQFLTSYYCEKMKCFNRKQCQRVYNIFSKLDRKKFSQIQRISKDFENNFIHYQFTDLVQKHFIESNSIIQNFQQNEKDNIHKDLKQMRQQILKQQFEKLDRILVVENISNVHQCSINFINLKVQRNQYNQIQKFTIDYENIQSIVKEYNFEKESKNVNIKSVQFIDGEQGFVLVSGVPKDQSSIYYFNYKKRIFERQSLLSTKDCEFQIDLTNRRWISYDNNNKKLFTGNFQKNGYIINDSVQLSYIYNQDQGVQKIISLTFLPNSNSIYFIDHIYRVFEIKAIVQQLIYTKLKPKIQNHYYDQIQSNKDGSGLIFKSQEYFDIYDLNLTLIIQIKFDQQAFLYFKSFSIEQDDFILIVNNNGQKCYQIFGLAQVKQGFITDKKEEQCGNSIFDYFFLAFKKFGPHSTFIGCPSQTNLKIFNSQKELNKKKMLDYFNGYQIENIVGKNQEVTTSIVNKSEFLQVQFKLSEIPILKSIFMSRVPIHAATIEHFNLVPLVNGQNIIPERLKMQNKNNSTMIDQLISLIKFGFYENHLNDLQQKVYVISIVGKQSSGKSYVLNRYFGTRFDVALSRCTDGIWISLSKIKDNDQIKTFLILDCEGLFSRRNNQEEMKLFLAISAISDITILNENISFNKSYNTLFKNFTNFTKMKGQKLFKGQLMILGRDLPTQSSDEDVDKLNKEYSDNLDQIPVLDELFKQKSIRFLYNFESDKFNPQINKSRLQDFQSLNNDHWVNGREVSQSLKIIFAQTFIDDYSDTDYLRIQIKCQNIMNGCQIIFFSGGMIFDDEVLDYEFNIDDQKQKLQIPQKEIIFLQRQELDDQKFDEFIPASYLKQKICNLIKYDQKIHNKWFKQFNQMLDKCLIQRTEYIKNYFKQQFNYENLHKDTINKSFVQLSNSLNIYNEQVKLCDKLCTYCARNCQDKKNHNFDCDCLTNHYCEEICQISQECKNQKYQCVLRFGHDQDKNSSHRCSQSNHLCGKPCEFQECQFFCNLDSNHQPSQNHNCTGKHQCLEKCQDQSCFKKCQFDQSFKHTNHDCGETRCVHKCILCDNICSFQNHWHEKYIVSKDTEKLKFKFEGTDLILDYHICNQKHQCQNKCTHQGICQADHQMCDKIWKNVFQEFKYLYFEPLEAKLICKKQINPYQKYHDDIHCCDIQEHKCQSKCIECKSFCTKKFGHDGRHDSSNHRNKKNNIYTSRTNQRQVLIKIDGQTRIFNVGESCQPENCTSSCKRKGRSHFHLKQCLNNQQCQQLKIARHSDEKYYRFEDKNFDQYLCSDYWQSFNWEPPVNNEYKELIDKCNFYCAHKSHDIPEAQLSYCKLRAWHNDFHQFNCQHEDVYNLIDIVFCCDSTGSMGKYIKQTIVTIKRIIEMASKVVQRSIKFGFVAYRDHPPEDLTFVTKYHDLSGDQEVYSFIKTLVADGGGDVPEAVMDGLNDSINNMNWRDQSLRYIFHIADAPPHGKQYYSAKDGFPNGCPCGITIQNLAKDIQKKSIRYKLLKIGFQIYFNLFKQEIMLIQWQIYLKLIQKILKNLIQIVSSNQMPRQLISQQEIYNLMIRMFQSNDQQIYKYKNKDKYQDITINKIQNIYLKKIFQLVQKGTMATMIFPLVSSLFANWNL